jgi:Ca-activated chloride channel family protein
MLLSAVSLGVSIWMLCCAANRRDDKPLPDTGREMTTRLGSLQERVQKLEEASADRSVAIILLVDVSGSMAEPDFDWNGGPVTRLEAVKRACKLFVKGGRIVEEAGDGAFEGRPTDLVGLVVFATRPETVCPLTLDHSALVESLDAEAPRRVPGEAATNIGDAVAVGLDRLRAAGARRKALVLLSDGEHNVEKAASGWSPRQAAQVAASLKVPIYAIDVSGDGAEMLRDLATITGGRYFSARGRASLLAACRTIDRLERQSVEKRVKE